MKVKFNTYDEAIKAIKELHDEQRRFPKLVNDEHIDIEKIKSLPLDTLAIMYMALMPSIPEKRFCVICRIKLNDFDFKEFLCSEWGCKVTALRVADEYKLNNRHLDFFVMPLSQWSI